MKSNLLQDASNNSIQFTFIDNPSTIKMLILSLEDVDCYSAIDSLLKTHGKYSLISLDSYLEWMKSLGVHNDVYSILIDYFSRFDMHDNKVADTLELVSGLLCYFKGSKSVKLSIAFSLFDEGGDGLLSRRSIWRMLRSFCRSLNLFCNFNGNPEDIAVESTAKIFRYFDQPKYITLEDLSDWYLFSGQELSFWLELLDYRKWLIMQ